MNINASGQIVGAYNSGDLYGFLYSGGTYTTIGVPGVTITEARGINASGHIVGMYQNKASEGRIKTHGFFYVNGAYASFDCPLTTTDYTAPFGINAAGHIVGSYPGARGGRGFLYINGFYADIGHPSAAHTLAMGINDNDQIVGYYTTGSGRPVFHGFLLSGSTYTTIDHPSATDTFVYGINNNGQVVGTYNSGEPPPTRGFLYNTNGGTYTTHQFSLGHLHCARWGSTTMARSPDITATATIPNMASSTTLSTALILPSTFPNGGICSRATPATKLLLCHLFANAAIAASRVGS